jgi:hypothetical protein
LVCPIDSTPYRFSICSYVTPLCYSLPLTLVLATGTRLTAEGGGGFKLGDNGAFAIRGVDVLPFSNAYDGTFSDAKMAGVEIIQHGERRVTNGDVRLEPTPGQWDPIPVIVERKVDPATQRSRRSSSIRAEISATASS